MKIILKSCTLVGSEYTDQQQHDILIENGFIVRIAASIDEPADHIIERENLHVSIGWMDGRVNFCDPGNEVKEDLHSGLKAAEAGGITAVAISPETTPPVANKSAIEYLKMKGAFSPVSVYPYGTLTEDLAGKNLAEMYDLTQAGAVAFTDGKSPVSGGIMYRALLYARNFDGLVQSFPTDYTIFGEGIVHEGKLSVNTGLKALPAMAEFMTVERDLNLLRYTEGRLHFTGISCKESVSLIRKAKEEGLNVTADVYVHNLYYTEEEVLGFDSNFKVLPPLRSAEDRKALIEGVNDGTLDFICSDHTPEDQETKEVEFDQAAYGMVGTQTLYTLLQSVDGIDQNRKIDAITKAPRTILNTGSVKIAEGEKANLTLFNPAGETTVTTDWLCSKSTNTPLLNKTLKGKVYGLINDGILSITE